MNFKDYKRFVIKLSGEGLVKNSSPNIELLVNLAKQVKELLQKEKEFIFITGGGNLIRGEQQKDLTREVADYIGMLSTIINALIFKDILQREGIEVRVQSPLYIEKLTEPYIREKAISHLVKKRVVIIGGGTGYPYFSTDTAAALMAAELSADCLLKGTKVDGIYSDDPLKNKNAKFFKKLTYLQVLNKKLKVMDFTSISLCMQYKLPIIVFNIARTDIIKNILLGKDEKYTIISEK